MTSPALYWTRQDMQMIGIGLQDLLGAAVTVMKNAGLKSVKKSTVDVAGRTDDSHSAITFLWDGTSWIAVVMCAGADAKAVRTKLSKGLAGLVTL
jgi:hypothetical protein